MKLTDFDAFCASFAGAQMVVQWGDAHVWKVAGKVFAIASLWGPDEQIVRGPDDERRYVFKASDLSFRLLTEEEGIAPAPYLGRYQWVQVSPSADMTDATLRDYIAQSYDIVVAGLSKKIRATLAPEREDD